MRLIKLVVPRARCDEAVSVLEAENVDFVLTRDASDDGETALLEFPLPTQAVGFVLGKLREAGFDDGQYTVIASAETAKTANFEDLEDRFVAGVEEDDAVATEEIRAKAFDMHRGALTYYSMTVFSAIVAAAGLLLDSPAVVVGAMVIAPQVGSAMTASVGMALDDRRMTWLGLKSQALGLGLAVVAAFAFGYALKTGQFVTAVLDVSTVNQITKRISPGLLSLSVALCAGGAGAFGLATALPVSLVGVMIAAALIPAAAAVGIGVAWGLPSVALGAFLLLVVNAVAVNLAGFLVLWYLGYRPDGWTGGVRGARRYASLAGAFLLLVGTFALAGGLVADQVAYNNDVNEGVSAVIEGPEYRQLEVSQVQTELSTVEYFGQQPKVTVVVSRPAGESYPLLAADLDRQIEEATGRSVLVEVQFTDRLRSE
ncbi:TIGR00341 family protein [Halomarina halobia]|uniref:TIGR00341 family protein n=1 Tax=Halomarina halobia TaxID=3033386 RepID=A0ABD6A614_9EURY|nr:TIGR00341 family protein [Halomarina sp. PSR21]